MAQARGVSGGVGLPAGVDADLRASLRHRVRAMVSRNPRERGRSATPLELLYDLTYVIAFGAAAEQLAHRLGEGQVGAGIGAYAFAIFAVTWAWVSSTWFASAFDNDDAVVRVATIVQMVGVIILTFGLPSSFAATAAGGSPLSSLLVVGYLVMRVPLAVLWIRAAVRNPPHRRTAIGYAIAIAAAQLAWVGIAVSDLPIAVELVLIVALALAEMVAPVVLEHRAGRAPWNPTHLAERFSLLMLITLGEVIAATTTAVAALVEHGWSPAAVLLIASGLLTCASLWWAYFLIPSRIVLELHPGRVFAWRYAHLPMFGAVAAIGAGLRFAAVQLGHRDPSVPGVAVALAVPVAIVLLCVFATWSVLMRSYDLSHVPLFAAALTPLAGAVVLGSVAGGLGALIGVVVLVALGCAVEVVGHEIVGYPHTERVLRRGPAGHGTDGAGIRSSDESEAS